MASIKYSALVTGMSGKLNGSVMARNKGGSYVRNKTTPSNPRTTYQQQRRAIFGSVSSAWRSLNGTVVTSWNLMASEYPYTDYWGDQRFLSGHGLHQKLQTNLSTAGLPLLTAPIPPIAVTEVSSMSFNFDAATDTLTVTPTVIAGGSPFSYLVFATGNVPAGKTFVKNDYRLISVRPGTETTLDISGDWELRFGSFAGVERIGIRVVCIMRDTGQNSVGFAEFAISD